MQDLLPRAERIATLLRARGDTVAVAESSAGGLISAALLAIPGASAYFVGGGVIYTAQARLALLGIDPAVMEQIRASTEPYALLLARTVRQQLGTVWGLSESGATGPRGNRYGDASGHACLAVSGPSEAARTLETGQEDRAGNMRAFAAAALDLFEASLRDAAHGP